MILRGLRFMNLNNSIPSIKSAWGLCPYFKDYGFESVYTNF